MKQILLLVFFLCFLSSIFVTGAERGVEKKLSLKNRVTIRVTEQGEIAVSCSWKSGNKSVAAERLCSFEGGKINLTPNKPLPYFVSVAMVKAVQECAQRSWRQVQESRAHLVKTYRPHVEQVYRPHLVVRGGGIFFSPQCYSKDESRLSSQFRRNRDKGAYRMVRDLCDEE